MIIKNVKMGFTIVMAILVVISFVGCAKPPTKEMSDARLAFEDAQKENAEKYAADQYTRAEEAYNEANQLMEQKKYKAAREKAIEAMTLAREAQNAAIMNKNAEGRTAKEMYDAALNAVNRANQAGAYTYAPQQMEDAQRTLEAAKDAYNAGDYNTAKQLAEAALTKAQLAEETAKQVSASKQAQMQTVVQQQAQALRDPGATPRPYPTNHVVIKGETLWWIAEYKQIYNDPFQWPVIYRANRSKIKDPDLIFPGQNFDIPRKPELTDDMIKEAIRFAKNRGAWSLHDGK